MPFVVVLAVLAAAIWKAMDWAYGARVQRLADERDNLQRRLTEEINSRPVTGPTSEPNLGPDRPEYRDDQRRHAVILTEIKTTAQSVGHALGENNQRGMEIALASARATLSLVGKTYDLQFPNLRGHTRASLEAGARFLTEIGPYLRTGQLDEARALAAELTPHLQLYCTGRVAPL
jgi:hypothetical protein